MGYSLETNGHMQRQRTLSTAYRTRVLWVAWHVHHLCELYLNTQRITTVLLAPRYKITRPGPHRCDLSLQKRKEMRGYRVLPRCHSKTQRIDQLWSPSSAAHDCSTISLTFRSYSLRFSCAWWYRWRADEHAHAKCIVGGTPSNHFRADN